MSKVGWRLGMAVAMASGALAACGGSPLELTLRVGASPGGTDSANTADGNGAATVEKPGQSASPSAPSGGVQTLPGGSTPAPGETPFTSPTDPGSDPTGSGGDPAVSGPVCNVFTLSATLSTEAFAGFLPTKEWNFSANESTIYVDAVLTGLADSAHQLGLYFYVPAGYLYRHEFVKFKVGNPTHAIQGYPWEYVQAPIIPEGAVVTYALPLTGPSFDINDFAGGWRLTIVLDDDPTPLASVWFEITPRP